MYHLTAADMLQNVENGKSHSSTFYSKIRLVWCCTTEAVKLKVPWRWGQAHLGLHWLLPGTSWWQRRRPQEPPFFKGCQPDFAEWRGMSPVLKKWGCCSKNKEIWPFKVFQFVVFKVLTSQQHSWCSLCMSMMYVYWNVTRCACEGVRAHVSALLQSFHLFCCCSMAALSVAYAT